MADAFILTDTKLMKMRRVEVIEMLENEEYEKNNYSRKEMAER